MAKLIKCPGIELSESERIDNIVSQFDQWIHTKELIDIIALFSKDNVPYDADFYTYVNWLKEFVKVWDYRGKQRTAKTSEGENARWLIRGDDFINSQAEKIIGAAMALGMISNDQTYLAPDYILPLGGTINSNYLRNQQAKKSCDEVPTTPRIVCLTTMRVLSDSERQKSQNLYFTDDCVYEFDSMCKAAEALYGVSPSFYEKRFVHEDPDRTWVIREYSDRYCGSPVLVIAAPSSDPDNRRANSADCFEFFFQRFQISEGTKLLNATGDLYCPYQQIRALSYAIRYNVEFDSVGYHVKVEPVNYLQEMKATVDAMYDFLKEFRHEQLITR